MSTFQIKVIAITTMIIDHLGFFLFPQLLILRMIGRIAFPLFSWLIANGAYHTKNINLYLARLFVFALISQIPYYFAIKLVDPNLNTLNILFTLFIGLLAIKHIKETKNKISKTLLVLILLLAGHILQVEYEVIGILSVIFFYIFFDKKMLLIVSQILLFSLFPVTSQQNMGVVFNKELWIGYFVLYLPMILLALFLTLFYNNKPGPKLQYFFYTVYPLQFVLFYLIKNFLP